MSAESVEFSFSEFCAVSAARPRSGLSAAKPDGKAPRASPPPPSARGLSALACTPRYAAVGGTCFFISRQR